ncbi:transducin/WD40 repeat-like superfamily protein [Striga asiatica]|uniref:Transducin/WD40 repeat-like superfamily protein n=1 Tax=Striga asiatica TaxID=4170 RepID=A0A5A7PCP1_STRAF|nr:transducin/WD40 repeat-like superfamily protein [Striga asiatica]
MISIRRILSEKLMSLNAKAKSGWLRRHGVRQREGLHQKLGMRPPFLKNLYRIFSKFSSNAQWAVKSSAGSLDFDLEFHHDGITVTFGDISEICNILFKQLEERFERLFSNLSVNYADEDCGPYSLNSSLFVAVEVVSLLFRCCLMLLTLLAAKQNLVLDKGLVLLKIVRNLSSLDLAENTVGSAFVFEKSFFRKCEPGENGFSTTSVEGFTASLQLLRPTNPLLYFISVMLEVFVDELLTHKQLRGHFQIINSFASTNETLFSRHSGQDDLWIVIAVLCNHFILSFSDKQASQDCLVRLFSTHSTEHKNPFQNPALSLTASSLLILSPIMLSMPKYMQAHLMSLVSNAIYTKSSRPDRIVTNCFLSIFEKSIDLYLTHISCLEKNGCPSFPRGLKPSFSYGVDYRPFEFYILPETKKKIDALITKLDNTLNVNSDDLSFGMKSDLVSSSLKFVKECLNVYAIPSQDEILSILTCLVLKASESCDYREVQPIEGTTMQHLYLLASILKLMGISLLQAISCLQHNSNNSCGPRTLRDFASCKEYDFVLDTIACFGDLNMNSPMQQGLMDMMASQSTRHLQSKMMFLHFVGLMSLSFARGLDCWVKACLLVILALLNLFAFEEGGLDEFQSIIDSNEKHFSSELSFLRLQEAVAGQSSSLVVASKFQKVRSLFSRFFCRVIQNKVRENEAQSLRTLASAASDMGADTGLEEEEEEEEEEETEETSNGEIFLECMLKMGNNISDIDDLVDFVECKQGKDYPSWLKNRQSKTCAYDACSLDEDVAFHQHQHVDANASMQLPTSNWEREVLELFSSNLRRRQPPLPRLFLCSETKMAAKAVNVGQINPVEAFEQGASEEDKMKVRKYLRGKATDLGRLQDKKLRGQLAVKEALYGKSALTAAKAEKWLMPSEGGYLEAEGIEKTWRIKQEAIGSEVDILSRRKQFDIILPDLGPYTLDFSLSGRYMVAGGRKGHLALLDMKNMDLIKEFQVRETVRDVVFLHDQKLFAAAQKKYVYMYNESGVEMHCMKEHGPALHLQFLHKHFLLTSINKFGHLHFQDITTGQMVGNFKTGLGRPGAMRANPFNNVTAVAHSRGTVTMWKPTSAAPLIKMLCHPGPITALAFHPSGHLMATAGMDRKIKLWDLRKYETLQTVSGHASSLDFSQKGLLASSSGSFVQILGNFSGGPNEYTRYMGHSMAKGYQIGKVSFRPYEDVLAIGHSMGWSSILVPGSGEPNFDTWVANPFETRKQRREKEVRALLDKLPPETIMLDPSRIGSVRERRREKVSREEREAEREAAVEEAKRVRIKKKTKGRSKPSKVAKKKKEAVVKAKKGFVEDEVSKEKEKKKRKRDDNEHGENQLLPKSLQRFAKKVPSV